MTTEAINGKMETPSRSSNENELRHAINEKLRESQIAANDPYSQKYTHEEVFGPLREKYGYEV